jgi:LPS export ABC transporter protein LptC
MVNKKLLSFCVLFCLLVFAFTNVSCTFDYGGKESLGDDQPDLIMENVEYVRVRSANPLAKLQAERVERYEKQSMVKLQNTTFEQYDGQGEEVNISGKTGIATVEIDTGNILMDRNVRIEVKKEDIILETYRLEWIDESKHLSAGDNNEVFVYKQNGTRFTGTGLQSDTRKRNWEFTGSVRGTYKHNDEDTEE